MRRYPAITVWQPWASLIAIGAKPFEFRGWAAPMRYWDQPIAIHAGARPVRRAELQQLLYQLYERPRETGLDVHLATPLLQRALTTPGCLPLSSIVCIAHLGRPIRDAELMAAMGLEAPINDSDRGEHSNWGWPLTDIEPLSPPLPAVGRQGFWQWGDMR